MIKELLFKLRNSKILLSVGIIFIAFNLRPAITSVGPLIHLIRWDAGITYGIAGLLTTLPLIAFAVISSLAPKIGNRWGNERTIFIGLIILGIGICIRSTELRNMLFIGTVLVGIGLAIGNVLLPALVKKNFPIRLA
ncbi:MFS transporter [Niallia sp. XMNu-256]|uniref:MFS transporter n=1 Tax=Niallia sp. XMNu-256 TaxID=3082444 RepID=UPI0030D13535